MEAMQKLLDNFIILNAFLEVLAIALLASVAYDTLVAADERSKVEGTAMCIKCQKHLAKSNNLLHSRTKMLVLWSFLIFFFKMHSLFKKYFQPSLLQLHVRRPFGVLNFYEADRAVRDRLLIQN